MNDLPPIGRPSIYGLSLKQLGKLEYWRQIAKRRRPMIPYENRWTGISKKQLGHTEYVRQWRKLKREKTT